ncbi:MAG TPA: phosphotransferase [Acidimicrobiales bacterium]|nr:phosphotransferase [Acidimicrobiales bacterium]
MIDSDALADALCDYLPAQRWFSGSEGGDRPSLAIDRIEVMRDEFPALLQVVVSADGARYQIVVGLRPVDSREAFLEGKPEAIIGELDTELGAALAYDAAIDPELALHLLSVIAPEEQVERARPLMVEQSNTSVVFDERLIMKLFRRLVDGPNPDAEISRALVEVGFENVAGPVAEWRGDGTDYAVVNEFLVGGAEGFSLALTSLRDLYDRRSAPDEAGGDFAFEARRLGVITARMHVSLAEAFGTAPGNGGEWADAMDAHLRRVRHPEVDVEAVSAAYRRLREATDVGPAMRIHGDYHLGQVMRTDAGWHVLDFEGEPDRPLGERRAPSSPMRDVAGMARSFHYAAQVALREFGSEADEELAALADAWEARNTAAFIDGYLTADGVEAVLSAGDADRETARIAFELDKAVYEVGYEQGHRPDWVGIPLSAVHRILERA